jgi:hypothetical protein
MDIAGSAIEPHGRLFSVHVGLATDPVAGLTAVACLVVT